VVTWGDEYLAYFTQGRSNVPMRVSTDWTTWSKPVDVLPVLPAWARSGRTWAPAVAARGGEWVLYFTAWHAGSGRQCIGTGTAATPYGPFEPSPEPIVCQLILGGSIDPSPFADATGSYLLWKSDENALDRPARLWASRLDSGGTALVGEPVPLLTAEHPWEDPLIENPAMVTGDDGQRWLFYSAGPWETARYSTGLAYCDGPLGPCRKVLHDDRGWAQPATWRVVEVSTRSSLRTASSWPACTPGNRMLSGTPSAVSAACGSVIWTSPAASPGSNPTSSSADGRGWLREAVGSFTPPGTAPCLSEVRCVAAPDAWTLRAWAPWLHPPRKVETMHNHRNHLNLLLGAAGVFIVLAALGVPVFAYLPVLAVLAICPLMMLFMMRGMDHGGQTSGPREADRSDAAHHH
jgi:hypothetical protein